MPVVRDIPQSLKTAEVLRRQGLRNAAKVRPEADRFRGTGTPQIDLHGHRHRATNDKMDTG